MTREEVLVGIAAVAAEHLGRSGPLTPEARLVEDLDLDSLALLTLAAEVENRFRICLDEDDEWAIETVGDLARVILEKLAAASER